MACNSAYHSSASSPKGDRLSGRQKMLMVLGLGLILMIMPVIGKWFCNDGLIMNIHGDGDIVVLRDYVH